MKPHLLFITILLIAFSSCENAIKDETVSDKETPENTTVAKDPVHAKVNNNITVNEIDDLIGYWVGWFLPDEKNNGDAYDNPNNIANDVMYWTRENKITVSVDTIRNDSVIGHSIVAGNVRPFRGSINQDDNSFNINASEPGDDKYDGTFSFSIEKNNDTIQGKWSAYKKVQTPKRKYSLTKQAFEYNPENKITNQFIDWLKTKSYKGYDEMGDLQGMEAYFATTGKAQTVNPSTDVLTEKEVEKFTKADIYVMRNSIYAKHGYSFKKRQLRIFFDRHDWYMPVHTNIKDELTDIEKQNIKLLLRYEKFAEEYYDEFGR